MGAAAVGGVGLTATIDAAGNAAECLPLLLPGRRMMLPPPS